MPMWRLQVVLCFLLYCAVLALLYFRKTYCSQNRTKAHAPFNCVYNTLFFHDCHFNTPNRHNWSGMFRGTEPVAASSFAEQYCAGRFVLKWYWCQQILIGDFLTMSFIPLLASRAPNETVKQNKK